MTARAKVELTQETREGAPDIIRGLKSKDLQGYVKRIENLETDKAQVGEDIRAVYKEAANAGFDVPTIKDIIKDRKKDAQELEEREILKDLYNRALSNMQG